MSRGLSNLWTSPDTRPGPGHGNLRRSHGRTMLRAGSRRRASPSTTPTSLSGDDRRSQRKRHRSRPYHRVASAGSVRPAGITAASNMARRAASLSTPHLSDRLRTHRADKLRERSTCDRDPRPGDYIASARYRLLHAPRRRHISTGRAAARPSGSASSAQRTQPPVVPSEPVPLTRNSSSYTGLTGLDRHHAA
jgi:hypothetical protein